MNTVGIKFPLALVAILSFLSVYPTQKQMVFEDMLDENTTGFDFFDISESFPEVVGVDKKIGYFRTTLKDPKFIDFDTATNQVKIYDCGAYFPKKAEEAFFSGIAEFGHIEKAGDLEKLIVLRDRTYFSDDRVQFDNKRVGYRESLLARLVEYYCVHLGILPGKPYSGKLFVDQYQEGIPMKWVLQSDKELSALIKYLSSAFLTAGITGQGKKPLLVLEFSKRSHAISLENRMFLESYFTLVEHNNELIKPFYEEICKFYKDVQGNLWDALSNYSSETKVVKQTFGEIIFNALEKEYKEFKTKEYIAGAIGLLVLNRIFSPHVKSLQQSIDKEVNDNFATFSKTTGIDKAVVGYAVATVLAGLTLKMMFATVAEKESGCEVLLNN